MTHLTRDGQVIEFPDRLEVVTPVRCVSLALDGQTPIVRLTPREISLLHVYGDLALASAVESASRRARNGDGEQYVLLRIAPPGEAP